METFNGLNVSAAWLHYLRVEVSPTNDDEVLDPSRDEELALVEEALITRLQVGVLPIIRIPFIGNDAVKCGLGVGVVGEVSGGLKGRQGGKMECKHRHTGQRVQADASIATWEVLTTIGVCEI